MCSISHDRKISVPVSQIKSPGALFPQKKSSSEPEIKQQSIQDLLGGFKSKIVSSMDSFPTIATSRIIKRSGTYIDCFMKSHLSENFVNPGKLKAECAELSSILFKAKEILSIYDIDLVIDNLRNSKEVYNLLKIMIPEVCFFPADFFKSIQLKQFIICEGYASIDSTRISVSLQAEPNKVSQRVYQIIWNHIIKSNPDILVKWTEIISEDDLIKSGKLFYSLEDVFIGLLNNTNHALMKPLMRRLRETLMIYYPETMSEDQLKSRKKEKKRMLKVHFV